MKVIRKNSNQNIVINNETNFRLDLGWQDNLAEFEEEVLDTIINPSTNYETVRYIHTEYPGSAGSQTDIWYSFFFISSGDTYVQDYNSPTPNITYRENALMLRQSQESFFRLEFYKTPQKLWDPKTTYELNEKVYYIPTTATTGNIYTSTLSSNKNNIPGISGWTLSQSNNVCFEPPSRQNRKLVFAKNLSLPLGEKYLYTDGGNKFHISVPLFQGTNYRNRENMYLFWFEDEKVLDDTLYFGNGTGNTFFMSAKFFNAKTGEVIDFTNSGFTTSHVIDESADLYYQVDFNHINRTYCIFPYTGGTAVFNTGCTLSNRVGWNTGHTSFNPIKFYERGGADVILATPTPLPTITPTPTPIYEATPTPKPTDTPTPTPTPIPSDNYLLFYYELTSCEDSSIKYSIGYSSQNSQAYDYVYDYDGNFYQITQILYVNSNPDTTHNNIPVYEIDSVTSCPTPTPTPTPTITGGPTFTPTPTPGGPTATPTPTPTPGGPTATPTPTPTITPTPSQGYDVLGDTIANDLNFGNGNGILTVYPGRQVRVILEVFGGTVSGGNNTGYVSGDISLSQTAPAFTVNIQTTDIIAGTYEYNITSDFGFNDDNKYAKLTFQTLI